LIVGDVVDLERVGVALRSTKSEAPGAWIGAMPAYCQSKPMMPMKAAPVICLLATVEARAIAAESQMLPPTDGERVVAGARWLCRLL
jgi:hypothetical protein